MACLHRDKNFLVSHCSTSYQQFFKTMHPKLKILFVDDEPHILEALSQLFDSMYDVHTANSGAEAIEYVKRPTSRLWSATNACRR